jgi:alginate O-acetyltransferase complex protein AlgI
MLFNSYRFILLFLPITLVIFYLLGRSRKYRLAQGWLVLMSLVFYGSWNISYLPIILASISFNYLIGNALSWKSTKYRKGIFVAGIITNLALLGYFKYYNFFLSNISLFLESDFNAKTIILPLGISFFTFQQISYLVDSFKFKNKAHDFYGYCLFVTFFPQLVAGPIIHHNEIIPQFANSKTYRLNYSRLAVGLTLFTLGLAKKIILADSVAPYANVVYDNAATLTSLSFLESWGAALAYTFQIYFDFSGYSDMAIGLGYLFGVSLPENFRSPYQAKNFIDFWRRWHITLSNFLRDYLYIPLGGNRKGEIRQYFNLIITMLLGGLWHGAGWTFIVWGGIHGLYLTINHLWNRASLSIGANRIWNQFELLSRTITFLGVLIAWVFFRAKTLQESMLLLNSMANFREITDTLLLGLLKSEHNFSVDLFFPNNLIDSWSSGFLLMLSCSLIVGWAPNSLEIVKHLKYNVLCLVPEKETHNRGIKKILNLPIVWAFSISSLLLISMVKLVGPSNEFLYFNF